MPTQAGRCCKSYNSGRQTLPVDNGQYPNMISKGAGRRPTAARHGLWSREARLQRYQQAPKMLTPEVRLGRILLKSQLSRTLTTFSGEPRAFLIDIVEEINALQASLAMARNVAPSLS
jgi:hypothetical protein